MLSRSAASTLEAKCRSKESYCHLTEPVNALSTKRFTPSESILNLTMFPAGAITVNSTAVSSLKIFTPRGKESY